MSKGSARRPCRANRFPNENGNAGSAGTPRPTFRQLMGTALARACPKKHPVGLTVPGEPTAFQMKMGMQARQGRLALPLDMLLGQTLGSGSFRFWAETLPHNEGYRFDCHLNEKEGLGNKVSAAGHSGPGAVLKISKARHKQDRRVLVIGEGP